MKTKLLLLVSLVVSLGIRAQIVQIPDASFKAKLLSSSPANSIAKNLSGNYFSIDANNDGEIQVSEALQVGGIEIIDPDTDVPIHDYEGILSFTNLTSIKIDYWNVPGNPFTISGLSSLQNLDVKFESYDPGSVSLSNCMLLKNVKIYGITLTALSNTPVIENLSINGFSMPSTVMNSIEGLNNLKNLELLGFMDLISGLTLDLSGHNNLQSLSVIGTSLANVDVSGCGLLHTITLNSPNSLQFININSSNCPNLVNYLIGQDASVSAHIISDNCPGLTQFICNSGEVSLSLNNCVNLETIDVRNLISLSVNNDIKLHTIKALRFRDTALDLSGSGLQNLKHLEISYIPPFFPSMDDQGSLTSLNVQGITSLEKLYCANHQISALNIQGCTNLLTLDCRKNKLTGLDVRGQTHLQELHCGNNLLTSLLMKNGKNEIADFPDNPDLQYICCDGSQVEDIQSLVNEYAYTSCVINTACTAVLANDEAVSGPQDEDAVKIYPIPVKKEIMIEALSAIHSAELYDAQGRIIQKQIYNSKNVKMNIEGNPSGVYYLKINTEKGSLMKKILKN